MECQAKRPIKKGEWFSLSDSDVESTQAEDRRAVNPLLQPLHLQTVFQRSPEEPNAGAENGRIAAKNSSHMRGKEAQLVA